jgi:acetolactate synthase-1/2/3 large subunit
MAYPLSRRDALKTLAAGCLASLPAAATFAAAGGGADPGAAAGWITGNMTGAQALVETLLQAGTECVFGIPGAQDNELWDTLKAKGLPYLLVTHEFSAACMADGYARSTGKVGVLCVVPGPGVTNALTGLGEALLDSVPVVCIACDVARGDKYRPFQVHELPQVGLLQQVTKEVFPVQHQAEIPTAVRQALALAQSGEPGPVGVVIPYPLFIASHKYHAPPVGPVLTTKGDALFDRARDLLADQKCRVGIYAGLGCMDHAAELLQLAETLQAPVATSVSGKGVISDCHPLAVGWGYGPQGTRTAEQIFKDVDLVLAIGVRYSEVSTAFYAIPEHRVIHVDSNPNNLGRIVNTELCVAADSGLFITCLLQQADLIRRPPNGKLVARIAALKCDELKKNREIYARCGTDPMAFILALRRCANADALVFVDVTATEHWAAEAFQVYQPRTYFNPTNNQAMGWSIPASLGAQRVHPGRQTIAVVGDGCFLMSAMEMSTAAREGLPVKFFVVDDQAYHLMQVLQKPAYLQTTATILARLDYAALAHGFGVAYHEINGNTDLEAAIHTALCQPGPVLTRVVTDYGKRPIRWVDAAKKQFMKELTTEQKLRFLGRIGSRAVHHSTQND